MSARIRVSQSADPPSPSAAPASAASPGVAAAAAPPGRRGPARPRRPGSARRVRPGWPARPAPGSVSARHRTASTTSSSGGARCRPGRRPDRPAGRHTAIVPPGHATPRDERLPGLRPGRLHHHPGAQRHRPQRDELGGAHPADQHHPGALRPEQPHGDRRRRAGWCRPSARPRRGAAPSRPAPAAGARARPGGQRQRQRGGQAGQVRAVEPPQLRAARRSPAGPAPGWPRSARRRVPAARRTVSSVGTAPVASSGGPAQSDTVVAVAGNASSRGTSRRAPAPPASGQRRSRNVAWTRAPHRSAGHDSRTGCRRRGGPARPAPAAPPVRRAAGRSAARADGRSGVPCRRAPGAGPPPTSRPPAAPGPPAPPVPARRAARR